MNIQEGDDCPIEGCNGEIVIEKVENCSCHINPPCSECIAARLICDECGEEYCREV